MRQFQIITFVLGVAAFVVSAFFAGQALGDTFWKVGVAILLGDLVLMMLWPTGKRSST